MYIQPLWKHSRLGHLKMELTKIQDLASTSEKVMVGTHLFPSTWDRHLSFFSRNEWLGTQLQSWISRWSLSLDVPLPSTALSPSQYRPANMHSLFCCSFWSRGTKTVIQKWMKVSSTRRKLLPNWGDCPRLLSFLGSSNLLQVAVSQNPEIWLLRWMP